MTTTTTMMMRMGILALLVALFTAAMSVLMPADARAERADDEPMFQRLALQYLSLLREGTPEYESGAHFGAFVGWANRLYWREFFIAQDDLNLHAGAFFQFEGFRIEGYGYWSDPFRRTDFSRPSYWEINANYMFRIDMNMLTVGIRRNSFADSDPELGFPNHIDEVYVKLIAVPEPLQGAGSVNIMYTIAVHQRISGGRDGTLIDLGFTTLSTNAWILGDVLSLSGKITWNQRFLQPYGRFSSYMFTAKIIKDLANIDDPGRGPLWLEAHVAWRGAINKNLKNELTVELSLWVIF